MKKGYTENICEEVCKEKVNHLEMKINPKIPNPVTKDIKLA